MAEELKFLTNTELDNLEMVMSGFTGESWALSLRCIRQLRAQLHGLQGHGEAVAWRYTSSQSFGRNDRKWHYQETFPHAENRTVQEIGILEQLYTHPADPDAVAVRRELLERAADRFAKAQIFDYSSELRALLTNNQEVKP